MNSSEFAESWTQDLTTPPAAGLEVCPICHSWKGLDFAVCANCHRTANSGAVHSVRRIVPITLWTTGSRVGTLMHRYKDPRSPRRSDLQALLYHFLERHLPCLANGESFDLVTHVPSKDGDPPHPLGEILAAIFRQDHATLLRRGPGAPHIDRDVVRADGFEVIDQHAVIDKRVLIVDDTFTTGATLQSAVHALSSAGANVPTALVIGRKITPEFNEAARAVWEAARSENFDWNRCCATDAQCRVIR